MPLTFEGITGDMAARRGRYGTQRGWRAVVARLGLLLVLLNVLAPSLAQAMSTAPADGSDALSQILQGRLVICTPTGLRVIQLDDQGAPLPDDEQARNTFCPFCPPLANAGVGALTTEPLVVVPRVAVNPQRPRHSEAAAAVPAERLTGRPRDPPSVI